MASPPRNRLFQLGSFALAGGLLYLALRGVDFKQVAADLRAAAWGWLIPMAFVTLFSHWLRAWRWTLLLDALPNGDDARKPVPVRGAFEALMIGYMVNYAAPRLGEVVRTANVSARYKVRFSATLGTVVIERIVDVVLLALALLTVPLVFAGRMGALRETLMQPASIWADRIPLGVLAAVAVLVGLAGYFAYRRLATAGPSGAAGRIRRTLGSFRDGLQGLIRTKRRGALVLTTVGMWLCYGVMAHLPFMMFGLDAAYGITALDSWGIMLLGAIGVAIPSPGGVGSYHYITIQALVLLFAMPQAQAATYALVTHAGQLVLYVTVGFAAIVAQGGGLAAIFRSDAVQTEET